MRSSLVGSPCVSDRDGGGGTGKVDMVIGEKDNELDKTSLCVSVGFSAIGLLFRSYRGKYLAVSYLKTILRVC